MDLELPSEIVQIQDTVRNVVRDLLKLEPRYHETGEGAEEAKALFLETGLYGMPFPEEYGGSAQGALTVAVVEAELSRLPPQFWAEMRALWGPSSKTLLRHGTKEQKDRWLPGMIDGTCPFAFALTEATGGSDVGAMRTKATRDGDGWVINGTKMFISNADKAHMVTVFAYTDREKGLKGGISAFLVAMDNPGVKVARTIPLMGTADPGVFELVFDNCRVDADALLGEEGKGFTYAMECINDGRINIGACGLGMGEMALELAVDYARQREAFGGTLADFQAIQHMIADMAVELHAARLIVYDAAWRRERGEDVTMQSSMAKLYGTEAGGRAVDKALQIFGGTGYCRGVPIERLYRDIRITRIYEGASELQRNLIGRRLLR